MHCVIKSFSFEITDFSNFHFQELQSALHPFSSFDRLAKPTQDKIIQVYKLCSKSFSSHNLYLKKHEKTGEKPFICTKCGRSFSSTDHLKKQETHTGEKPFRCTKGGRSFSTHETHPGEKPFRCTKCGRSVSSTTHETTRQ